MAFRGRGRGRGRPWGGGGGGGFGFGFAKQEEFVLFPDIELPDVKGIEDDKLLRSYKNRLQNYWRSSAYYLEDSSPKDTQSTEIERYSDRFKKRSTINRGSLMQYLELNSDNFPRELVAHRKFGEGSSRKKVRWNTDSDMQRLDLFEKLEQKYQGQEGNIGKDKKEGEKENDEDDDEGIEEAEEEFSSDGDYNQNVDFDDDEDDFNMEDDHDDEPTY